MKKQSFRMESAEITWKVVNNTVKSRMKRFSLAHKLVPCTKIRRRTKIMNTQLKQMHGVKTYNEYIKMKTSVLRNLSDDSDTDNDEIFTVKDYSMLYQSDVSLANYVMNMSRKSASYLHQDNTEKKKNSTPNIVDKKINTQNTKKKSSKVIGWMDVVKKKKENTSVSSSTAQKNKFSSLSSLEDNVQKDIEENLNMSNSQSSFRSHSEENSSSQGNEISRNNEACITKKLLKSYDETTDLNEITHNIIAGEEIKYDENKSIEQPILQKTEESPNTKTKQMNEDPTNFTENRIEESQLDEHHSQEMFKSQNAPESIKRNLMSTWNDENTTQDFEEPSVNKEAFMDQTHMNCLNESLDIERTSVNENKGKMFLEMQSLFNDNTNQPKDSGIDEDTEEEFPEEGKKICEKLKKESEETHENLQSISSASKYVNNSAVEMNLSTADNDSNDNLSNDALDKMDTENVMSSPFKSEDSKEEDKKEDEQNRTSRQKSQPRVTCTEIVHKRYRIVSCSTPSSNDCTSLETNTKHFSDQETLEIVETDQHMEDSMSPLSKKRLQQLRRLNLTADSESSLSEDDDKYCTVENMRNKLLKRSKESSDVSSNEDENANFGHAISVQFPKKKKNRKKLKIGKYKKEVSCSLTTHKENEEASDNKTSYDHMLKSPSKKDHKKLSENSFKGIISCLNDKDNSESFGNKNLDPCKSSHLNGIENHNFDESKDKKRSNKNELGTGSMVEIMNKKSRIRRPSNLQGFIEEENLIHDTTTPSFRFKDIEDEDDVFILDIPSMVLDHELVGKKIVLTENKLKLGKKKYKITFKDVDHVSCVFGTGKSRKPYKSVNIKPITRVVASQKIVKPSFETSNRCTSDAVSYAEDTSEIETDVSLRKKTL